MASRAGNFSPCTYPHSCVCQQPAHSPGHRHTCSCLVCWHSVAHSDHCPVWSTHPSLKTQRYVGTHLAGPLAQGRTSKTLKNNSRGKVEKNLKVQMQQNVWNTQKVLTDRDIAGTFSPRSLQPLTSDLWRSWQQSRPCWRSHLKRISSTGGWSWFWCHLACRSHRSGPAEGCFQSSRPAPPGSHRHNCHVSQSEKV